MQVDPRLIKGFGKEEIGESPEPKPPSGPPRSTREPSLVRLPRIPIAPELVERMMRSPEIMREQVNFLARWGGPEQFLKIARLPRNERLVYTAIQEGYTTKDQIEIVTGLTPERVERALEKLMRKGLIGVGSNNLLNFFTLNQPLLFKIAFFHPFSQKLPVF